MPKDLPSVERLWEGDVRFFSIDTNLLQAAGFGFSKGALHQLPRQLPKPMGLQLPAIIVEEVVNHRLRNVRDAIQQVESGMSGVKRLTNIDVRAAHKTFEELDVAASAEQQYRDEIDQYAKECRGSVMPVAGADAAGDLFSAYFKGLPPFGQRKDKKNEFPDAMCLWLLEQYAEEHETFGIIASQDEGWRDYAATSPRLYHVGSIEELAALFAATDEHAQTIKASIATALRDAASPLRAALDASLDRHAADADWDATEVYSGSVARIEPDVYGSELVGYDIGDDLNIWPVDDEPTSWVAEFTASVIIDVTFDVEFFAWDSIDREELSLGTQSFTTREVVEANVYLTCTDVHLASPPAEWQTEIEVANGRYTIEGFEVEPDYGRGDH